MATKFKSTFSPERTIMSCETDPAAYFTTSERIIPSPAWKGEEKCEKRLKLNIRILTVQDN
jgi:hypothetical protein